MKTYALIRILSLIVLAAIMTLSASAADVAGIWTGSMDTQAGNTQVVITIQAGPALKGKVQLAEYDGSIEKGELAGDKISFETTITHGTISFGGTVSADRMELNVVGIQGDRYKLICIRQK
jgi:hypothetical protein